MRREETIDHHIKTVWHAIARMYNQQAAKYDLTMSMGFVLLNINAEEGTPATKIAPPHGFGSEEPNTIAKKDGRKELIYKQADINDKRSVRIFLTDTGKKKKERSREVVLKFNNTAREKISDEKLKIFFDVVQEVNQIIEKNNIYQNK